MLTCDHGPGVHTGGQLCVLQACLLAGVGWVHWESARASTSVRVVLWTHWTCRVCAPPPQLRLHTPHSPTDQLGQHNTARWVNTHSPLITDTDRTTGIRKGRHGNCTMIATGKDPLSCNRPPPPPLLLYSATAAVLTELNSYEHKWISDGPAMVHLWMTPLFILFRHITSLIFSRKAQIWLAGPS